MKKLIAYNNRQSNKDLILKRHAKHIELDTLIRGQGYMERTNAHWKGCNITCLLNKPSVKPENVTTSHANFNNTPFYYPTWLGHLLDCIHERCSSMEFSQQFTHDLIEAIPLGFFDWRPIMMKFLLFVLQDIRQYNPKAVNPVIKLYKREISSDIPAVQEWRDAADAATAAYAAAAGAAAYATAAYAAIDRYALYLIQLFKEAK